MKIEKTLMSADMHSLSLSHTHTHTHSGKTKDIPGRLATEMRH